jgi:hypothetical protein
MPEGHETCSDRMRAGRADEAKKVVAVSKRGYERDEFEIVLLEVKPGDGAVWGIPSFWNVDVNTWQEWNNVVIRVEEKAFLPIATQQRVCTDVSVIGIGGTDKQYDVCKIGRIHEGMLSEDIAARRGGESIKVRTTVAGDAVIGGGQHMHCRHRVKCLLGSRSD